MVAGFYVPETVRALALKLINLPYLHGHQACSPSQLVCNCRIDGSTPSPSWAHFQCKMESFCVLVPRCRNTAAAAAESMNV
eukprot:scaffold143590_cov36-Tisochrysis_lutea.AAC.1